MKKLLTLIFVAFAFYAEAQPVQADPNVIIGEDATYADYWELKAQSDRLDILSTGIASPIIRFAPLAGTGNRLVYMTSDGDIVAIATGSDGQFLSRSGGVPAWVASPGATPGGSDTQLQYRVNSTTFGGISGATSSGTNVTFGDGNARMTSPWVTTSIDDSNGNIVLGITATGSAVNYFQVANGATGTGPTFTATGSDANINLNLTPKGTGFLRTSGTSSLDGSTPITFRIQDNQTGTWTAGAAQNAIDFYQSDASGIGASVRTRIVSYTDNTVGNANGLQFYYSPIGMAAAEGLDLEPDGDFDIVAGNLNLGGVARISNAGAFSGTTGTFSGTINTTTGDYQTNGVTRISQGGAGTLESLALTTSLPVSSGGSGVNTITGYIKGNGTSAFTGSATIPTSDLTGTLPVANGGTGATSFTAGRVLFGNGTNPLNTSSELFWDNAATFLGIGITPLSQLHVYENNTTTGTANGITIEQDGTGDAMTQYLLTGGIRYVMGIDNSDSDKFKLSAGASLGSTDLMTFTSGTGVGFGITPSSQLHVYESTTATGSAAGLTVENASTGDAVQHFIAGGTTWSMGIDNSASVDQFTISPAASLSAGGANSFSMSPVTGFTQLVSASAATHLSLVNTSNNAAGGGMSIQAGQNSGTGTLIQFSDGDGTSVGGVTFSGTTTTYNTTSDERLKKDITPTKLNPKKLIGLAKDFTWIEDGKKQTGFIAQEVYKIFPWAVHAPDSGMWSVDYGQLTPLLAKGYEDNEARITALENADDKSTHWALWTAIAGLTILVLGCLYTISTLAERISKLENK